VSVVLHRYHWSVKIFEETHNPGNAQLIVMEREPSQRGVYYKLSQESRAAITLPEQVLQHEDYERQRQIKISANMFSMAHDQ